MDEVIVQVPATSANLGPGYDCLGVAFQIYNRVTVRKQAGASPPSMAADAAAAFFRAAEAEPFPFDWRIEGDVPPGRGLGSSVTVRWGTLVALNELGGQPLSMQELFQLCSRLEGHPDNAGPAGFGGFAVTSPHGTCQRFDVSPEVKFVLLIPSFEVSTPQARALLPREISHSDAARSCANACRVTAAFASGNYQLLRGAFEDHLHQPWRMPLIPFLNTVIRAGEESGALGGFLSGSGSTIACVTLERPAEVAEAMLSAVQAPDARTVITRADNTGVKPIF